MQVVYKEKEKMLSMQCQIKTIVVKPNHFQVGSLLGVGNLKVSRFLDQSLKNQTLSKLGLFKL
jgi:hypothetical protein